MGHGSRVRGQYSVTALHQRYGWSGYNRHSGQRRAHFRNRTYNTRTERQLVLQSKKRSGQPVGNRSFKSLQERKNKKTANSSQSTLDQAEHNFRPRESSLMQIVVSSPIEVQTWHFPAKRFAVASGLLGWPTISLSAKVRGYRWQGRREGVTCSSPSKFCTKTTVF